MGAQPNTESARYVRMLVFLFGGFYFAQGLAQAAGLISQPLDFFLKEALGLNPDQAAKALASLTIPWVIKPIYGIISDFFPLAGYRRKSWLVVCNLLAAGGFLWLSGLTSLSLIIPAIMLTCVGIAASDVIIDALMVENGKKYNSTARFQSVQWLWFYVASIATSLAGGYLCEWFGAAGALHVAALIVMFAPLAVLFGSWFVIKEEKAQINRAELAQTLGGFKEALKSKTLWAVAFFIAFWTFSPSFGLPFYYHMTDKLGFTQSFIGILGAISSGGSVIGALLYGKFFSKKTLRYQLIFSIITGTIGTVAYLSLVEPSAYAVYIAIALNIIFGACGTIAMLATMTLAAQACPAKAEGFTFAALMSVNNFFTQLSSIVGAWMFVHWFGSSFTPLIWVSAGFTFACFLLLPTLRGVKEKNDDTPDPK